MIADLEHLDEAEGGPKPAQSRLLAGSTSAMSPPRLPPRRLVAAGPQVQIDPAALELQLVDLALAVVFAAGLEGEDLQVAGQVLELGQQFSHGHLTQSSVSTL